MKIKRIELSILVILSISGCSVSRSTAIDEDSKIESVGQNQIESDRESKALVYTLSTEMNSENVIENTEDVSDVENTTEFVYEPGHDYYEESMKKATAEQKEKLLAIRKSNNLPGIGVYVKQVLKIMGEIDEDSPNISLEQIKNLCDSFDKSRYEDANHLERMLSYEINKIAVVPDFDGGSMISHIAYYIDGDPSKIIDICMGQVVFIDEKKGEKTVIYEF